MSDNETLKRDIQIEWLSSHTCTTTAGGQNLAVNSLRTTPDIVPLSLTADTPSPFPGPGPASLLVIDIHLSGHPTLTISIQARFLEQDKLAGSTARNITTVVLPASGSIATGPSVTSRGAIQNYTQLQREVPIQVPPNCQPTTGRRSGHLGRAWLEKSPACPFQGHQDTCCRRGSRCLRHHLFRHPFRHHFCRSFCCCQP